LTSFVKLSLTTNYNTMSESKPTPTQQLKQLAEFSNDLTEQLQAYFEERKAEQDSSAES